MRAPILVTLLALAACSSAPPAAEPEPRTVTFQDINSWPYTNGLEGIPAEVQALSGTYVKLTGVALPLDFGEVLLADPAWRRQPDRDLRMNSVVHVYLPDDTRTPSKSCLATCSGTFVVGVTVVGGLTTDIYQLHADRFAVDALPAKAKPGS